MLGEMLVGENSRNDAFERVKQEPCRFLKETNVHKVNKEKLERKVLERRVAIKSMTWFVVDLGRTEKLVETVISLPEKNSKELLSY